MKTFLIILSSLAVLFIIFQAYTTMATNKSEEQPYKVIKTEKDFEIRFYPSVTMATITSSAKSYKELGSSGFNKLAGYIFGGNDAKKQIAMTAPVHMDINDSISSMSFVMPSTYNAENLPKPNDAAVNINKTADAYVAAIKFSGFASDSDIKNHTEILKNALKAASISYYGNFRYLGYNPPYQLVGRRNEVIINVNWDAK
jgi:SOUL heme-binding protein